MPTTEKYGSPGKANEAIGGLPVFHYLDFFSRGRGQAMRLLFEDTGIAYEDVRYTFEELPEAKESKLKQMNPAMTLPIIELNGKILTQSYALLRHFSRLLKKYDGNNEDEKYWVDALCDLAADWRNVFVSAFFDPDKEVFAKHQETSQVTYRDAVETQLKGNELSAQGPYVLGDELTYADMVIYQICHDEGLTKDGRKGLQSCPRLKKLVDALEARPNIAEFLNSERYRG